MKDNHTLLNLAKIPKSINLSAGRSCFVQCTGCYNHFGKDKNIVNNQTILNFLRYAYTIGVKKVTLCGGDPLSRLDIIDLLKEIKKLSFYISLDTVGTPMLGAVNTSFYGRTIIPAINPKDLASFVDMIGIPIDGPTNEIMRTFRNNRMNILDEQLAILDKLEMVNANICINTVVHKQNIESVPDIIPLIKKYNCIRKWQLFQYMPIGPLGYKNRELFEISEENFCFLQHTLIGKLEFLKFKRMVEFKSKSDRKGVYLLVDSDGFAWIPKSKANNSWNIQEDTNNERYILGNIHNMIEYEAIFRLFGNYAKSASQLSEL